MDSRSDLSATIQATELEPPKSPEGTNCADSLMPTCRQSRRSFLASAGYAVMLSGLPGASMALGATRWDYPRRLVVRTSKLADDELVYFRYPDDDIQNSGFIVKLGERAGGGVGRGQDIVAFSAFCPHMGGVLAGVYNSEHKVSGPCPLHLTTFDLTRHGMVISGHATQSLPQILLQTEGDNIYAVGVQGLIYGLNKNQ